MPDTSDAVRQAIAHGESLPGSEPGGERVRFFEDLARQHPDDAEVRFALGGAYDSAGSEREAVAPYQRARQLGLPDDLLPRWYVQYGSTLRNNGDLAGATATLTEGHARFPNDLPITIFLALARHTAGDPDRALQVLLKALVTLEGTAVDLRHYTRAIGAYADDLTSGDEPTR